MSDERPAWVKVRKAAEIREGDVVIVRHPVETPGDVHYSRFTVEGVDKEGPEVCILYYGDRHKYYAPGAELETEPRPADVEAITVLSPGE